MQKKATSAGLTLLRMPPLWLLAARLAAGVLCLAGALAAGGAGGAALCGFGWLLALLDWLLTLPRLWMRRGFWEKSLLAAASLLPIFFGAGVQVLAAALLYRAAAETAARIGKESEARLWARLEPPPDTAQVFRDGKAEAVPAASVTAGEPVVIPSGSVIPVDALVVKGESLVGLSALTACADVRSAVPGGYVYAGTRNETGLLAVRAEKTGAETLLMTRRARAVKTADAYTVTEGRFSRYALFWAVLCVLCFVLKLLLDQDAAAASGLLLLAAPFGWMLCVPIAARQAVLRMFMLGAELRDADTLPALARIKLAVFGREGVQSVGRLTVAGLSVCPGGDRESLLRCAATAHFESDTVLGGCVRLYCGDAGHKADSYVYKPGGVIARRSGQIIHAGTADFLRRQNISVTEAPEPSLCVALDGRMLGSLHLSDILREGAAELSGTLLAMRIDAALMTSADKTEAVRLGERLGIADVHPELSPAEAERVFKELCSEADGQCAYVGTAGKDGGLLGQAPVGISLDGFDRLPERGGEAVSFLGASPQAIPPLLSRAKAYQRFILLLSIAFPALKLLCAALYLLGILDVWHIAAAETVCAVSMYTAVCTLMGRK